MKLKENLELPCGTKLPNRIGKSAMSENMANPKFCPGEEFYNVYKTWIDGDVGLCITGNVMVDSRYLGEANNVVIEKGIDNHDYLKKWASAVGNGNSSIWVQLNHPGKQTPKFLTREPVAPSSIELAPPLNNMFNKPRALTEVEIYEVIERFAFAAKVVKECGFGGVQIHGAHGYLVSQFLSERHNQRTDQWGGSLENRLRFVQEIYLKIREYVGKDYPIGIKLNSADFGRGGFTHQEAIEVTRKLSDLGIDLIEISGGSYEAPVMTGILQRKSSIQREAYFLEYAKAIKEVVKCPLMVTGGFRTSRFMEDSLTEGHFDIVGLGRALCLNPNLPKQVFAGESVISEVRPLTSGFKAIDKIFPLEIIWYTMQIHRMGKMKMPAPKANVYFTILSSIKEMGVQGLKRVRS